MFFSKNLRLFRKSFLDFNLLYFKIQQKKGWEKKANNLGIPKKEKIFKISSYSEKEIQESNSRIQMIGGIAIFILFILNLIEFLGWT